MRLFLTSIIATFLSMPSYAWVPYKERAGQISYNIESPSSHQNIAPKISPSAIVRDQVPINLNKELQKQFPETKKETPTDWTGFYVGGQLGALGSNVDLLDPVVNFGGALFEFGTDVEVDLIDFSSGMYAGYDFQLSDWIIGIETGFQAGDFVNRDFAFSNPSLPSDNQDDLFTSEMGTVFSASARLGRAWDKYILYSKIGLATADFKVSNFDTEGANSGSRTIGDEERHYGFLWGIGGQYKINSNFYVGLDYSYINFAEREHKLNSTRLQNLFIATDVDPEVYSLLMRLGYRFSL